MTMSRSAGRQTRLASALLFSRLRSGRQDRRTVRQQSRSTWRSIPMTFLEQITLRRPSCDAGFGRRRSSKAHPRRVNRRLTLIGICVVAPFIGPAACRVERVEARESRTAAKVIVRPVVTPVSVPRVALHQDEKGGPQVFVYSPAERRVHARGVVLGTSRSGDVDIASGLGAGEMIVIGSREPLADGAVVQRINEPIVVTAAN